MKKLIFASLLLFSLTAQAQYRTTPDTAYVTRDGAFLRRVIQYQEVDGMEFKRQFQIVRKRERNKTIFTLVTLAVFTGLTGWYFTGVSSK